MNRGATAKWFRSHPPCVRASLLRRNSCVHSPAPADHRNERTSRRAGRRHCAASFGLREIPSHQLRLLRAVGLVTGARKGRSVIYALYDNHVAMLLDEAVYHIEHLGLSVPDEPSATA